MLKSHDLGTILCLQGACALTIVQKVMRISPFFPSWVKPHCIPHLVTKHPARVFNSIRRSLSGFVSDKCNTCQDLSYPLLSHEGALFLSICFFIVLLNGTQLTFYLRCIIHGTIKHNLLYLSIFSFNLNNFRETT